MKSKISRLGEIAEIVDSLHKTPKYSALGRPMVRATDVKYGPLKLDATYQVSNDVYDEFSRRYNPSVGDIIITRVGSYGNTAYVEDVNFCLGQNTSAIIPKINSRYLFLALNSPQVKHQIDSLVVGSTQKTLSLKAISSLEIPRFSQAIENFIACACGQLDDKIQLNQQINQTLEQMAQAIFKSWFVDFEPVKAKIAALEAGGSEEDALLAAMQVISGKDPQQLAQLQTENPEHYATLRATAELFPEAMQESELGEIPEGWSIVALGSLSKLITKGTTPSKTVIAAADDPNTIQFIKVRDISKDGEILRDGLELFPKSVHEGALKRSVLEEGDLLFSIAGTIGRIAIVDKELADSNTNQAVGIVRLNEKNKLTPHVWLTLKSERVQENITSKVVQGVQANASLTTLRDIEVVMPCNNLLDISNSVLGANLYKIIANQAQNRALREVRDVLLPKLLSGELSLADLRGAND